MPVNPNILEKGVKTLAPSYVYREASGSGGSTYNYAIGEGQPNYDPYVTIKGVLKNKLNISSYDKLREEEFNRLKDKVLTPELVHSKKLDISLLKAIHKFLFSDIYDWAGEFRIIPLMKLEEFIIPNRSIEYATPDRIVPELKIELAILNSVRWGELSKDDIIQELAFRAVMIWKIHPFRDGNTRAILGFIKVFAIEHGFSVDMSVFTNLLSRPKDKDGKVIGYSVRDLFVYASHPEIPNFQPIMELFKEAITINDK